jgi:hypothetical protein
MNFCTIDNAGALFSLQYYKTRVGENSQSARFSVGRGGSGLIFSGLGRAWVRVELHTSGSGFIPWAQATYFGLRLHTSGSGFLGMKTLLNKLGFSQAPALLHK